MDGHLVNTKFTIPLTIQCGRYNVITVLFPLLCLGGVKCFRTWFF